MRGFRTGIVDRAYLGSAGEPLADVIDEFGGVHVGVRFLGGGGGGGLTDPRFYVPLATDGRDVPPDEATGAEVVMLLAERFSGLPVIVGTFHNGRADERIAEREEPVADDADVPQTNGPGDVFAEAGGARLLITSDGDAVLDTSQSGRMVRLQVGGGLRISQDGDSGEGVVLSGPLINALATLVSKVNSIGTRLAAVESALVAAANAGDEAVVAFPAAPNSGYTAFSTAAKLALGNAYSPATAPGDELVSSAITIPTPSKGDELP